MYNYYRRDMGKISSQIFYPTDNPGFRDRGVLSETEKD